MESIPFTRLPVLDISRVFSLCSKLTGEILVIKFETVTKQRKILNHIMPPPPFEFNSIKIEKKNKKLSS